MKTTTTDFKRRLRAIRRARGKGNADAALAALEKMLKAWPDHPHLLVEKSRLVQLSENGNLPLTDAKRALERAIAFDDDSPKPWIELGYYLFVNDDLDEEAEKKFDHAIELSLRHLIEAITGKIEAVLDQDDPLPARKLSDTGDLVRLGKILAERYQKNDSQEIGRLRQYIEEYQERFEVTHKSLRNGKNGKRS